MKYLSDYTQDAITELLDELGAFFAFSQSQFDEQKKDGVEYTSIGAGCICPKGKAKEYLERLDAIGQKGIDNDIAENGKKGIIHRELGNHEYSYTHDISQTVDALSMYGITAGDIQGETGAYLKRYYEWEEAQELATA